MYGQFRCRRSALDMSALTDAMANRAWLRRRYPFPHIVARNVFVHDFYAALATQLHEIMRRGLSEVPAKGQISRNIPGYDAYGIGLSQSCTGPIAIFLSVAWRDLMCELFAIGSTPYVFAGVHHHLIGSAEGFIHNDFNPVWFPRASGQCVQIPNQEICAYKTGAGTLPESDKIQVVRGAVVIFFLLNDGWRTGDGGETGLYSSGLGRVSDPAIKCPPENNSLIAFECTPRSFHAYRTNTRLARTSIIMWVHRTTEEAADKYGEERFERWKT
jgi:hypothetical protein